MTNEEAIEKAMKLLRLSRSDNPHEAALAAARAQEIIDRYKLANFDLNQPEEPIRYNGDPIFSTTRLPLWISMLVRLLADANQTRSFQQNGRDGRVHLVLVGKSSDVQIVRYMFQYLVAECERIIKKKVGGLGKAFKDNFRVGLIDGIGDQLAVQRKRTEEAVRAESGGGTALVKVDQSIAKLIAASQALDLWVENNLEVKSGTKQRMPEHREDARSFGREVGREIDLGGQSAGSLAPPKKQLT